MTLGALGGQVHQMSRAEIAALPPACSLADLARALGVSEPTIRGALKRGELAEMGIRVNRVGQQYRCVTSTLWAYLGLVRQAAGSTS